MSRGIRVYKVPSEYASVSAVTSTGSPQYRDVILVNSTNFNEQMSVWQYDVNVQPQNITSSTYSYTDEALLGNVSLIRKAHMDDYRSLINALKVISINKFGDTIKGLYNLTDAKLKWDTTSAIYKTSNNLAIDFTTSIDFSQVDGSFSLIKKILSIVAGGIEVYGNITLDGSITTTGNSITQGNQTISGDATITKNLVVNGTTRLDGNLTANSNNFTFTNATGTPPFIAASNTVVNNLNSSFLQDKIPGNASNNIAVNNGTICGNLNADMLDDYHLQQLLDLIAKPKCYIWQGVVSNGDTVGRGAWFTWDVPIPVELTAKCIVTPITDGADPAAAQYGGGDHNAILVHVGYRYVAVGWNSGWIITAYTSVFTGNTKVMGSFSYYRDEAALVTIIAA